MIEVQKELLTEAISMASSSADGSNWDAIYASLTLSGVQGGHADFLWNWQGDPNENPVSAFFVTLSADQLSNGGCEWSCRYGFMDQIHWNNFAFHLDTVGVNWAFPLGAILHAIIDVGFGNINPQTPLNP